MLLVLAVYWLLPYAASLTASLVLVMWLDRCILRKRVAVYGRSLILSIAFGLAFTPMVVGTTRIAMVSLPWTAPFWIAGVSVLPMPTVSVNTAVLSSAIAATILFSRTALALRKAQIVKTENEANKSQEGIAEELGKPSE